MTLTFRWLGTAGLEFAFDGARLLVDPFFTRPSTWALISGRPVAADAGQVSRFVTGADFVLVTHPHYDHLLDVPEVLRQTGASAYGSSNTCALLSLHGVPENRITCVQPGSRLALGPFVVEVFPARHTRTPLDRWLNGPLRADLCAPCRLTDYRMDACYSFRITVSGSSLLVGDHPVSADELFISPYHPPEFFRTLLGSIRPLQLVPIHWDDFTRPLTESIRPMLVTPAQVGGPVFPPLRRLDLEAFRVMIQQIAPEVQVHIPQFNTEFHL